MLTAVLDSLGRHAMPLLAGGIFIGLVLPGLAALLHPLLSPLIFLRALATMIRIEWPAVRAHMRRPRRVLVMLAWTLVGAPVTFGLVVPLLGLPAGLAQAIVTWSSASPLFSTPALAFILGLDASLALVVMVLASFIMPFTLPPLVLGLLDIRLELGIAALTGRLVLFIGGAVLLSTVFRHAVGVARIARHAQAINGFNVLMLILFAIAIMDGVGSVAVSRPRECLLYVAAAFGAALVQQGLATALFLGRDRRAGLTLGMLCGNRNMGAVWASLGAAATPELTLFFAALQLPIYTLPALLRPFYRRLLRHVDSARGGT